MTQTELARLAGMANALRPDWPAQSILTFLTEHCAFRAYRDAAVALAWLATDDATSTPKRLLEAGPWWLATAPQRTAQTTFTPPIPAADPDDVSAYLAQLRGVSA